MPLRSAKQCFHCQARRHYFVPRPHDCPEELRKLDEDEAKTLSLLEISTGPYVRAAGGYRQHTDLIRFSWQASSVKKGLADLQKQTVSPQGAQKLTNI